MIRKFCKNLFRNLIIVVLLFYVITIFVKQETSLSSYRAQKEEYLSEIKEAKDYQEKIIKSKENATDLTYIEQVAREKIGMYLPNERVYIDIGK